MENSNSQPTPLATPPTPPAQPTAEEYAAKVAELERQSEGRLRDLQAERQKRQELESRLNPPPASSPVAQPDVTQDELGKVLNPYIAPLAAKVQAAERFVAQVHEDKAMDFLSAKTGKSKEALLQDKDFQEKLVNVARRYGFTGSIYDVTVKAYDIMELENLRAAEAERKRVALANANANMPGGDPVPPVVGGREYSESDWAALPLPEYDLLTSKGTFHQNEAGKIVFTPNK